MSRILIVDDEPDMRLAVRNVLKLRGYEIQEAGDGPAALELARADRPDLVLLDMRLPGMDGIEVLEALKKMDESVPVVMITGYGHIQSAVDVMKLGASEYLQKPFENSQLVETVKKFAHAEMPQKRSYEVPLRETPRPEPVRFPAQQRRSAAEPARARRFSLAWAPALALAALLAGALGYAYLRAGKASYYREYPGVAANVSSMLWRGDKLVAGDWLARAVYIYAVTPEGLKAETSFPLEKTHISGLAVAGDTLYVADSWRKVIEARAIKEGLPLLKTFPMPGKVSAMFYDGEYLWTCDADGNAILRRADSELTPTVAFRLPEKPDQIFRDDKYLWTAVSSTGMLYRHKLDDSLTPDGVYSLRTLRAGYPLSAFAWKDGRLWLARDGLAVLTEAGSGELIRQD
ncbi:MAG: response regulator [Elusimicrobia bacterium]|nr:response regulator [Elusimicrobiota bacterium]